MSRRFANKRIFIDFEKSTERQKIVHTYSIYLLEKNSLLWTEALIHTHTHTRSQTIYLAHKIFLSDFLLLLFLFSHWFHGTIGFLLFLLLLRRWLRSKCIGMYLLDGWHPRHERSETNLIDIRLRSNRIPKNLLFISMQRYDFRCHNNS